MTGGTRRIFAKFSDSVDTLGRSVDERSTMNLLQLLVVGYTHPMCARSAAQR